MAALAPRRARPVVAVVGLNAGTEVTDYLMPYGILKRSGAAEVVAVATAAGPVKLYPAGLSVAPEATTAQFDARHPEGADYVIAPAMARDDDPAVLAWIRAQAKKGAIVIGVCAGAKVVAEAGLLDGRRATTHWYYLRALRKAHPDIRYVADRRIVVDGRVATTTGVSASMPLALTLIEAIAGRDRAQATAEALGVMDWRAGHDSGAFRFTRPFAARALANRAMPWRHETLGLELTPGMDEVSLALAADAWSRTFRSRAETFTADGRALQTMGGLAVIPARASASWPAERRLPPVSKAPPAAVLEQTLTGVARRYGAGTADFVAMQLEYPRRF